MQDTTLEDTLVRITANAGIVAGVNGDRFVGHAKRGEVIGVYLTAHPDEKLGAQDWHLIRVHRDDVVLDDEEALEAYFDLDELYAPLHGSMFEPAEEEAHA